MSVPRLSAVTAPWIAEVAARTGSKDAGRVPVERLGWKDLIAVGDGCLQVAGASGARPTGEPAARRAYFAALYRACQENSFEGILEAARAFAELGDGEVVEECLGLAELKVDGAEARRRLSILVQRLEGVPAQAARAAAAQVDGLGWSAVAAAR